MISTVRGARGATSFLALGCVGFIATAGQAQTPPADQGTEIQGATVTDTAIDDEVVKVDRVESPKYTAPLLDTPQTITVISAQTLRQQNLLTLKDALSTIPGITFGAGEGGGGYGDSINLRGYSANNDITMDGVRDSAQYSRTETFNVQQIEVFNGANSAFNGSGSVGGTINIVQKRPTGKDLTVLGAAVGTDNYYRGTVDVDRKLTDTIGVRLNGVYHHNDVPGRDVEKFRRWGIAPSVTFGMDTDTRFTLQYVHQEDDNTPQYGVPYYAAAGGLPDGADRHGYYGYRNVDDQRINLDQVSAILEHDFNDNFSVRNLTRYQNVKQTTIVDPPQGTYCLTSGVTPTGAACTATLGTFPAVPASGGNPALPAEDVKVTVPAGYYLPSGPRGNRRDTDNKLIYTQTDFKGTLDTGGIEHSYVLGFSLTHEEFDLTTGNVLRNADGTNPIGTLGTRGNGNLNFHLPYINIADPSAVIVGPSLPGASYGSNYWDGPINYIRSARQYGELDNAAVYFFDTVKFGEMFELNGGVRYEWADGKFRADTISTSSATLGAVTEGITYHNQEHLFSYRIGAVFKPVPNASIYVAFGNSKTPSKGSVNGGCTSGSGATLSNFCNTAPETAKNYEIGAKADLFDKRLQLTAALFRNDRTNFRVQSNDPANPAPIQVLDGHSRVDGVALGAAGNITNAWAIFANYTYLDSKIKQGLSDRCVDNPALPDCAAQIPGAPIAGAVLVQTPKHAGSLFTTYLLPFGLQLGYGLTYQASIVLSNTPSTLVNGSLPKADDYLTHRLFASYAFANGLTAQVNVQNVTNEKYFTGVRNNGWANPGATRSATLSLFYSF